MSRFLFLGGLAVAVWLVLEVLGSWLRSRLRGEASLPALRILARLLFGGDKPTPHRPGTGSPTRLVRCAACGQHVLERSARPASTSDGSAPGSWICSPECTEARARRNTARQAP